MIVTDDSHDDLRQRDADAQRSLLAASELSNAVNRDFLFDFQFQLVR